MTPGGRRRSADSEQMRCIYFGNNLNDAASPLTSTLDEDEEQGVAMRGVEVKGAARRIKETGMEAKEGAY